MGGGIQCTQSMCRYHGGVLSQYVHIGYITQALYLRIAFVADLYHKVREYFVYRDDHGLGCMAIHLAHYCFSFNMRWM